MRVAFFFFALYASVGLTLGYLPPYFRSLGFSGKEIGAVASLQPLLMMVVPPVWGYFADRTRRPTWLLQWACLGAALAFSPLLFVTSFWGVALCLAVMGLFSTTLASLGDTVAVVEARRIGTDYARLRLWGSLGFVVATWGFGTWLTGAGRIEHVVPVAFGAMLLHATAARGLRPVGEEAAPIATPNLGDVGRLARDPALLLFFAAGMIHWAALAPYHLLFALHLGDLGASPSSVGAGFAIAVLAEVVVMWQFRRLLRRVPLAPALLVSFSSGLIRWLGTAWADSGTTVALLQVIHGINYGAFYVGSVAWLENEVPAPLRATGRALFASLVFGVGGVLGNALAGTLYDLGKGRLAFLGAAGLDLLPPLLFLLLLHQRKKRGAPEALPAP